MLTIHSFLHMLSSRCIALPLSDENDLANDGPEFDFDDDFFRKDGDDKIVGGNDTTIEAHPHQVSLRWYDSHQCGGAILTATRALTAAHCIIPGDEPSEYSIMAGSTLRTGDGNQQIRTLKLLMRHPRYGSPTRSSNDVGLLYWEEPLTFGDTVHAIALAPQGSPVPYGENCNVTGWGRLYFGGPTPNVLQVVTKPLVSNEECNRAYGGRVKDDMLCAGVPEGGRDSCQGDSGGPLTVNGVLYGVVSWGHECARPGFPGVYARVASFNNWINENL